LRAIKAAAPQALSLASDDGACGMAKGVRRLPRFLVRGRAFARGCGEMLGAARAGAIAIGELCLGRWPQPDRLKPQPKVKPPKVAPYPVND
jgi:hypothetical protein